MKVKLAKITDKYLILILCYILSILKIFKAEKKRKKIAIIRLWSLGETILTLPMIKRIKDKYPDSKITVICTTQNKLLFENQDFIDEIQTFSPKLSFMFKKFDLAIDTEPFMNLGSFLSFWLAKNSIGYKQKKAAFLYTNKIKFNDKIHSADNFIRLAKPLRIPQEKLTELTELNPGKGSIEWANSKILKAPLIGLCITTGGTGKSRRWPIKKWLELSQELIKKYKPTLVIIGAPNEKGIIESFQKRLNYLNTVNTTNIELKKTIALTSKLNLMISSDTGPMHIAAAQGIPTMGLFCPNTPTRFAPLGKKNSYVYKPILQKPCINVHKYKIPNCKNHPHMKNIKVEDVIKEVNKLNKKWKTL